MGRVKPDVRPNLTAVSTAAAVDLEKNCAARQTLIFS